MCENPAKKESTKRTPIGWRKEWTDYMEVHMMADQGMRLFRSCYNDGGVLPDESTTHMFETYVGSIICIILSSSPF